MKRKCSDVEKLEAEIQGVYELANAAHERLDVLTESFKKNDLLQRVMKLEKAKVD